MVLVTGQTGSGKTTTMAALLDLINRTRSEHILTVEDPIEYVFPNIKSLFHQRQKGEDTKSFANALKAALREDPDIILVGEMRDLDTIGLAISAAETGHLVFGTLHTNSASATVDRMLDVFPPIQQPQIRAQLSGSLVGVCSQNLVPTISGGRCAAQEIMLNTPAMGNLIREGKTTQIYSQIQMGAKLGMQTMEMALAKIFQEGKVSWDAAMSKSSKPEELERLIGPAPKGTAPKAKAH
jgi:twitching motility protein PilT